MLKARHIPNVLTVLRLLLVPPIAWALLQQSYVLALALFLTAGVSDGVDGFLARSFNWQSQFGATLDPIADKLLMITTFFCLAWLGHLPWWLFALILGRDILITGGAVAYQWVTHSLEMHPLLLGKLNTALQIVLVLSLLMHLAFDLLSAKWLAILIAMMALSTVISGAAYVLTWARKATRKSYSA